ncbi:sigma-E processing peptidase SpoIIGA [Clostridiaceae bacterium M8S5]|nr:sigma-E processing peptidase SpoIIGA [Clostridiaceae bacterium M8S5]
MYIYAEYLIAENLLINLMILYLLKVLTKSKTRTLRLVIASLIGAVYTLVVFFPALRFLATFVMKICISILMIIIAFNPRKLLQFIKLMSLFYIITFAFAGAALALFYLTEDKIHIGNGIFYINNSMIIILPLAILLSWLLFKTVWAYISKRKKREYIIVSITLNGIRKDVLALLDTGNSLKEPITNKPVIVVEFSAIKDLLPQDIQTVFKDHENDNNLEILSYVMENNPQQVHFRLIPFKSLGKENGLLIGFKPDLLVIHSEDEVSTEAIIGIYNSVLSNDDDYCALLHPEVLK